MAAIGVRVGAFLVFLALWVSLVVGGQPVDVQVDADVDQDEDQDTTEPTTSSTSLTRAECLALGFDPEVLDCKLCDEMAQIIDEVRNNPEDVSEMTVSDRLVIVDKCMACCVKLHHVIEKSLGEQYDRAVLEVCTCKFGKYPKVANFVNNLAKEHERLTIKYMNARHPHLVFYDKRDNRMEEVSIASWNEETISEFLKAKLKKEDSQLLAAEPAAEPEEELENGEEDNKDEL